MVDREVDWPVWVFLVALGSSVCGPGPLLGLCWRSGAALGSYVGGPGPLLAPMLAVLGPLGTYVGGLGPLLGPMLAVLGRSWGLCWRSWATLRAYVRGPRPSWDLRSRKIRRTWLPSKCAYFSSGSAICDIGGGLEPLLGSMLAVLGRS